MTKKNKYVAAALIASVAAITIIMGLMTGKKNDPQPMPREDISNVMLTQSDGKSDSYYRGENNEKIYVNTGTDTYDLTDCVVDWSFGLPVINLNKAAEKTGLEITDVFNEKIKQSSVQVFAPEEIIDPEQMETFYIVGENDTYVKYKTLSGLITSGNNIATPSQIASSYHPVTDVNHNYLITIDMFPRINKNGEVSYSGLYSIEYDDETIIYKLN